MSRTRKPDKSAPSHAADGTQAATRRHRRSLETRVRLFRTAIALFARHGFSSVTVEDITHAADVGKGTFFNYFETKDHVLGVIAELQISKIKEAADRANAGDESVRSILHDLAFRLIEEPGQSQELARAVVSSFLASKVVRDLLEENTSVGRATIAEIVAMGQKRGEIDPDLKKKTVALQFQQAVMGTILLWSLYGKPDLSRWIETSYQHFWRAIAAQTRK